MKSLILITVCVYYMQTCFAEPKGLTDHEWEITRSKLKNSPGMETETFEKLVEILNKYRNDPAGLLTLAMQGDTCTKNRIDFKHLIAVGYNISEEDATVKINNMDEQPLSLNDDVLQVIEEDLKKYRPADSVQHAMNIFSGRSPDNLSALVHMFTSAEKALRYGCSSEDSTNDQV